MIVKKYKFGDIVFEVKSDNPLKTVQCVEEFLYDDADADYVFEVIPEYSEGKSSMRTVREGNTFKVSVKEKHISELSAAKIFVSAQASDIFPDHDAFILHSSYIIHEREAILFSAPSGTGKSTQADFWHDFRACVGSC